MNQDQLEALAKKIKDGTATKEETGAFLDGVSIALEEVMTEDK